MQLVMIDYLPTSDYLLLQSEIENDSTASNYSPSLQFDSLTDSECLKYFRFRKADILKLVVLLQLPDEYRCPNRSVVTGLQGLLILLRRLTYPNRLCELAREFGRSTSALSIIINTVLEDIYLRFNNRLSNLHAPWVNLRRFSDALNAKGCPVNNCWGFIDGTCMAITRPSLGQRSFFSGHKRQHCLKFQGVMSPCGLIAHMFGPIEGCRHDSYMLAESKLMDVLSQDTFSDYTLYGDPAYPITPQLLVGYRGDFNAQEARFNKEMSKMRQSVEWGFGKVKTLFSFLDYKKNLKILLQPVPKYFLVGTLFTNLHSCLYGSETSFFFDCVPPTIDEYLA